MLRAHRLGVVLCADARRLAGSVTLPASAIAFMTTSREYAVDRSLEAMNRGGALRDGTGGLSLSAASLHPRRAVTAAAAFIVTAFGASN